MAKQLIGFLPNPLSYGDDNDVVLQLALTSAPAKDVESNGSSTYTGDTQGGGQTYSANGLDPNTSKALRWNSGIPGGASRSASYLDWAGTMTYEIPSIYADSSLVPAATKYFWCKAQGYHRKLSSSGKMSFLFDSSNANDAALIEVSSIGKGPTVRIDTVWNKGEVQIFVDYLKVGHIRLRSTSEYQTPEFGQFYIGGLTTVADSGPAGYPIKNFQVVARETLFPVHPLYGKVGYLGDSFTAGAQAYAGMVTGAPSTYPSWNPGPGWQSAHGSQPSYQTQFKDVSYICELTRTLSKAGIWTDGGRGNFNQAVSGSKATDQVANYAYFTTNNLKPQILVCGVGTNDAAQGTSASSFATSYQNLITTAYNDGVSKMVLWTVPSLRADSTYRTPTFDGYIAAINQVINTLPLWAANQGYGAKFVTVVDIFNLFGGHNIDSKDFGLGTPGSENIHPSIYGNQKLGKWMGEGILSAIK